MGCDFIEKTWHLETRVELRQNRYEASLGVTSIGKLYDSVFWGREVSGCRSGHLEEESSLHQQGIHLWRVSFKPASDNRSPVEQSAPLQHSDGLLRILNQRGITLGSCAGSFDGFIGGIRTLLIQMAQAFILGL